MSDGRYTCEEIARELGQGKEVKLGPGSYNTFCPAHNNHNTPALTVTEKNGKIIFYCHSGCAQDAVIDALKDRNLWPKSKAKTWTSKAHAPKGTREPTGLSHPKFGAPSSTWQYKNRAGLVAGMICRFNITINGKSHKETIPVSWCMSDEGEQRFWWKQMPEPRCLYNEYRLGESKPILIVEGEKSCDAAQKIVGDDYLCMTWPGGSKAVKRANWTQLKGRDVILWPDADEPGDQAMRWLAEILIEVGVRSIRRVALPAELYKLVLAGQTEAGGWDLADPIPEDMKFDPKTLIRMAPDYRPQGDSVVDRFNQNFALVMIGGQAIVLQEDRKVFDGRVDIKYMSIAGFKEFYGNRQVMVGKQQIPESAYWLKHEERRSYTSVVFEPRAKEPDAYNLWRGFSVDPDSTGDWSLLDEHIKENLAKGDESLYRWILGWFAHIIQHPDEKSGTSLAFRGKQGTGKTIIGKAMGALYKPHYVLVEDSRYVIGQFNSHMASTLLLHADEAFFAGDPRHIGKLKGMVTSDTHRIEMKGKDTFEVSNYIRLLVTSNNDFIMPAAFEERRFAVLDTSDARIQDKPFFRALWRQLENGGFGGLLHHLQTMDLSTVDVTTIPETSALQEQKLHSLDGVMRFWYERLHQGQILPGRSEDWPTMICIDDLYESYIKRSEDWGERRRVDIPTFGKELKKVWPNRHLKKIKAHVERNDRNGYKVKAEIWAYELETLKKHRDAFKVTAGEVDWPLEEEMIARQAPTQKELDDIPF